MIPKPFATPRIPHGPPPWRNLWGKGVVICHLRFLKELSERRRGISPSCPPHVFQPVPLYLVRPPPSWLMGGHSGRPQWEARVRDHNERPQQEATTGRPRPEGIEAMTGRPHRNVKARFERHRLPLEHDSPSKPYPSDVHTNCQQSTVPTGSGPMQQMQPKVATTTCQSKSEARPARESRTV